MTLDEARLTLKELRYYPSLDDFDVEAVNIAIKAVEAIQKTVGFLAIVDFLGEISNDGGTN